MKLADLRRVAIRGNLRIRFRLANGTECLVDEHGVGQVPSPGPPVQFNLEEQLASVQQFDLEPAAAEKGRPPARTVNREQLANLAGAGASASPAGED